MKKYFVGWDVGAWYCDKNRNSRDAWFALGEEGEILSTIPFWGNCKDLILKHTDIKEFLKAIFKASGLTFSKYDQITIAIDTPLGFPVGFRNLLSGEALPAAEIEKGTGKGYKNNAYLFRATERFLATHFELPEKEGNVGKNKQFIQPLSAIQHMIGAQATKGLHFLKHFNFENVSTGIWTNDKVTAIEVYPATYTRLLSGYKNPDRIFVSRKNHQYQEVPFYKTSENDIKDAYIAAILSRDFEKFQSQGDSREVSMFYKPHEAHEAVPKEEGWIWALKRSKES